MERYLFSYGEEVCISSDQTGRHVALVKSSCGSDAELLAILSRIGDS